MDEPIPEPQTPAAPRPRRRRVGRWIGIGSLVLLVAVGWWIGPFLYDLWKLGFFEKIDKRSYSGTTMDNFKSMHMAMMLYHESEEAFPEASGWMDAIEPRLQTYDMDRKESLKKMVSPEFQGQGDKYGYAMNDSASRKYKDDISEPDRTPLLFDSRDLSRNAHGDPAELLPSPPRDGQNRGVSVSGQMLEL